MRIASTMMSHNYLKQLNGTYQQYAKLMEQSDGSKLHRASDDAVGYSKYLRYQNNKISNEQYQDNVSTASSWMKNADAALVNVTDLLQTFKAKTEQAANSTNNESDMKDIAKELLANVQEQVADLNTQIGDRFLFAGQKDTSMPFTITDDKMDRGETYTLDEKQQAFFSGAEQWGKENTTMKQLLKLNGDDGSAYYMNVQTGDIYTEDFVVNGYKNEKVFDPATQRVACVNEYRATGSEYVLDATGEAYFGSGKMTSYEDPDDPTKQYYADENGNLYEKDFVETGFRTATDTAADHVKGNLKTVDNFRMSEHFDEYGVIKEGATGSQKGTDKKYTISFDTDGNGTADKTVNLTFATTKQYIVKYNGDDKYISMVKKNGGVDQATDTVNVTGQDINGTDMFDVGNDPATGTAMLNQLMYTVAKIEGGDNIWAGAQGMTIADTAHATVLGAETKMAARQQAYTAASGMLTTQNQSITSDITDVSSTDVAYLATKLMEYQTIYSMSLSVGSKILPGSLADYLN